jgi:hypothetical protein
MDAQELWIRDGQIILRPTTDDGKKIPDKVLFFYHNLVKIELATSGITVKWTMFRANWTSLLFAKQWLSPYLGPFSFVYFNAGWFTEKYEHNVEAITRLDNLIFKSDIRFSASAFTKKFETKTAHTPHEFAHMWKTGSFEEASAVHCIINIDQHQTKVEEVGSNSALAKIWGVSPQAFPRLSGHSYDRVVSPPYYEVARTLRPHYDHVLAAMTNPDGEVRWHGYHRIIFPGEKKLGNYATIKVVSEVAQVDIPLL